MIRATKMSGKWYMYAFDFEKEEELENIQSLVDEGSIVLLGDNPETVIDFIQKLDADVDEEDITIVSK